MRKDFKKLNTITLIVIWALYCISLMLPALTTATGDKFGGLNILLLAIIAFFPMVMMLNEAGDTAVVTEHNLGFYFWVSAIVLLSTLVFINWILCRNRNTGN